MQKSTFFISSFIFYLFTNSWFCIINHYSKMIESVKKIITCKWCNYTLDEPVFLPCGETICKKHELNFKQGTSEYCKCCGQPHKLKDSEHFPVNKMARDLLLSKLQELDFGADFKMAQTKLENLKWCLNHYEVLKKNPEDFIFEFFNKLRNKVDLAREDLIQKINDCSEKLMSEIAAYEKECRDNIPNLKTNESTDQIKAHLDKWEKEMSFLKIDNLLWSTIKMKCGEYSEQLMKCTSTFECSIFPSKSKVELEQHFFDVFNLFGKHVGFKR
jgi:hypothetical protein